MIGDVAGERVQDDAVAPSLRNAGLERVEDRVSVLDFGDLVCVVESVDVEVALATWVRSVPPAVAGGPVDSQAPEKRCDPPATAGGTDLTQVVSAVTKWKPLEL
jgi:hypothetical protein